MVLQPAEKRGGRRAIVAFRCVDELIVRGTLLHSVEELAGANHGERRDVESRPMSALERENPPSACQRVAGPFRVGVPTAGLGILLDGESVESLLRGTTQADISRHGVGLGQRERGERVTVEGTVVVCKIDHCFAARLPE